MTATTATDTYRAARDLLLDLREDPDRAHAEFSWPHVGDRFNWAVDWFDADPLADIKNIRKIRMVMKDGVIIDRDKLPLNPIIYKRAAM